ncbi:hypothetical protein ACHAW5_010009 [Stephanodiscus triporus]|uniref:Amino acid transporter transmembrane domain-containing protein n=1 Tax=Stephanodiscus triporus TaxID=2934178 RepID=A0ABD3NEV0_9STRA
MKTAIPTHMVAALFLSSASNAFRNGRIPPLSRTALEYKSSSSLEGDERRRIARQIEQMSSSPISYNDNVGRSQRTSLSVATLEGSEIFPNRADRASLIPNINIPAVTRGNLDDVTKVLSASCLVIGNTVGSSMFVLPEAVGGVGLAWGSVIFFGLYIYNLISGLLLADVAISLHESSECEVPSSF